MQDEEPRAEETVCFCHDVKRGRLIAAIRAGARTLEQIQSETLASTGCGGCEYDVMDLLELLKNEQGSE